MPIKIIFMIKFKNIDDRTFMKFLKRLEQSKQKNIIFDFCVVPDIVGGGNESLELSLSFIDTLRKNHSQQKFYLAVQDGMNYQDVEKYIHLFDAMFSLQVWCNCCFNYLTIISLGSQTNPGSQPNIPSDR